VGRAKENPRYHVMSLRVGDDERDKILEHLGSNGNVSLFLLNAALEKVDRDQQVKAHDLPE